MYDITAYMVTLSDSLLDEMSLAMLASGKAAALPQLQY